MSYLAEAKDIVYRANFALTAPNTKYMDENLKSMTSLGYTNKDYSSRLHDLLRKEDPINRLRNLYDKERNTPQQSLGQNITYQSLLNPSKT